MAAVHTGFMRQAIQLATQNVAAPFAALLVDVRTEEVRATGINQSTANPTWHGEIVALGNYAKLELDQWRYLRLYTTAEPCVMCQAAILWAGIPEVVYGTSVRSLATMGWKQFSQTAHDVVSQAPFADCEVLGGVLEAECDALFAAALACKS